MTKEQAQKAYRLAYVNALNLIYVIAKPKRRQSYWQIATEQYGLSEQEAKDIWYMADEDMRRRYLNWRDNQISQAEDFAENYAKIYVQ